jgi:hypothetical protein
MYIGPGQLSYFEHISKETLSANAGTVALMMPVTTDEPVVQKLEISQSPRKT